MEFVVSAIVVIIVLLAIRVVIRGRATGPYVQVYQTRSRTLSLPAPLTQRLEEEGIRYKIRFMGPHHPFGGMTGDQYVTVHAHVEDLEKARRLVSKLRYEARHGSIR